MVKQKQKQTQKVVINIGETKPRRKRTVKKAPRRPAPSQPGAGGGAGGGTPQPPAQPSDFFPRGPPTVILPNRVGPLIEPGPSLAQLIKPLEQTLLALRQPAQPPALPAPPPAPPAPPAPPSEGKEESTFTEQDFREMFSRHLASLPIYREDVAARPAVSYEAKSSNEYLRELPHMREIGTQTIEKRMSGQQIQMVQPEASIALIQDAPKPLVDALIQPVEAEEKEEAVIEQEFPELGIKEYTQEDIRIMDNAGEITRSFLDGFPVKKKAISKRGAGQRGFDLLDIGRALGLRFGKDAQGSPKDQIIDFILENKGTGAVTFKKK